jgi:TolB protein
MKIKFLTFYLLILQLIALSCKKENSVIKGSQCPPFSQIPSSPYDDPVWHPSGKVIGFNHRPIKKIIYTYGFECPEQATHLYDEDLTGFYLINEDGTNFRRALSFPLGTPSWSPDGNYIAFSQNAQIYIMPFNGENFETEKIFHLQTEGRSFYPTWSPDGEWIAYDSDFNSPKGAKFIWKINLKNFTKERIGFAPEEGEIRMPHWGPDFRIVHQRYIGVGSPEIFIMNSSGNEVIRITTNPDHEELPQFSPDGRTIAFVSRQKKGGFRLFSIDSSGNDLKMITNESCVNFSWAPDGRLVYLKFDFRRIDENFGTLWLMDADGNNQNQLTFNDFEIIK